LDFDFDDDGNVPACWARLPSFRERGKSKWFGWHADSLLPSLY
jgi:hypothetical protein